jgi:PAS domain S-box-containing protein
MAKKPTYKELDQKVKELEKQASGYRHLAQALTRTEQEKTAILDSLLEHVVYQDTEMNILWANQAACNSIGMTREDLIGRRCYEVWVGRERTCEDCPVAKARDTGKPQTVEKMTPDRRWWYIQGYPVRDDSGQIVGMVEVTLEITERKRAEEALRESEANYRLLFSAESDAIVVVDAETKQIVDANQAALALYGYGWEEFVGLKAVELSAEPEKTASHIEKLASGKPEVVSPGPVERVHKKKDDTTFFVEFSSGVYALRDRKMICVIMRDITDRKQAQRALKESQERYRQLWDEAPVAYHRLDTNGIVLQANQTEMNMLGYARDEMVGKPIFEFILAEQRKDAEERFRLKLAGKHIPKQDNRIYVRKDGSKIHVSIDDRLERDAEGKVIGVRTTMVDISDRKRAEDAVRESQKKYSTLVESSLTGIYIVQDGKIVFANNRFADIYGYRQDELIGMESWRLVYPEDRPLTDRMRKGRLKGEDVPSEYEARGLTKAGETIWVNRRNSRIEFKEGPAILGNIIDVTEQKRAEEKLRKVNEELNNFVRIVSHDLKNPIISVKGFSSRLLKSFREELGDKGRRYLEQILASSHRMDLLVSDLLELSQAGQVLSTFKNISSIKIVRNVMSSLLDRLEEKDIELVVADNLPIVHCDGERMYQVFENLIANAIKYMGDTEKPKIEVGYKDRGDSHQFYVRDNGIGIDSRYQQKIFEMFQRLKATEDEQGTGLGLAIVERVVNNHAGIVWVESEKGEGATFHFTLPKTPGIAHF